MQVNKVVKGLIQALGSRNEKIGRAAAQTLLRLKGNETVPALMTTLEASPSTQARFRAARLLGEISLPREDAHVKSIVVDVLIQALQDEEDAVRINTVTALGKQRDSRASQEILSLLVAESNPLLRFAEVQALGDIGAIHPDHLALLVLTMIVIMNDESNWPATREGAENTLMLLGAQCLPCLEELMKHEDPLISSQANTVFENISKDRNR